MKYEIYKTRDGTSEREMSMRMHPDQGGNQEQFIHLTECKNLCLKWASRN